MNKCPSCGGPSLDNGECMYCMHEEPAAPTTDLDPLVLYTVTVGGNLHYAARYCDDLALAAYVLTMQYGSGDYTTIVLRMPLSVKLDLLRQGKI